MVFWKEADVKLKSHCRWPNSHLVYSYIHVQYVLCLLFCKSFNSTECTEVEKTISGYPVFCPVIHSTYAN